MHNSGNPVFYLGLSYAQDCHVPSAGKSVCKDEENGIGREGEGDSAQPRLENTDQRIGGSGTTQRKWAGI